MKDFKLQLVTLLWLGIGLSVLLPQVVQARMVRNEVLVDNSELSYQNVPYRFVGQHMLRDLLVFDILKQLDNLPNTPYLPPFRRGGHLVSSNLNYLMPFTFDLKSQFITFLEQLCQPGKDAENLVMLNSDMLYQVVEYVAQKHVSEECSEETIMRITEQLKKNIINKDIFEEKIRQGFSRPLTSLRASERSIIREAHILFEEFLQLRANTAGEGEGLNILLEVYKVVDERNQILANERINPLIQELQQRISTLGNNALSIVKYALLTEYNERVLDNMIVPAMKILIDLKIDTVDMGKRFKEKVSVMYTEYFDEEITGVLEEAGLGVEIVTRIVGNDFYNNLYVSLHRLLRTCQDLWVLNDF